MENLTPKHALDTDIATETPSGRLVCSITPSADGSYECPCGFHPSKIIYRDTAAFNAHLRHLVQVCKTDHEERPTILTSQLVDTPTLRVHSLVINTEYRLLLCTGCSVSILPTQVGAHFRETHDLAAETSDLGLIQRIANEFAVPSAHAALPAGPIPAIEGLPIVLGYQCPTCSKCYAVLSSFGTHFRSAHPGQKTPTNPSRASIQRLTTGVGVTKQYFVVTPPSRSPETQSPVERILEEAAAHANTSYIDTKPDIRNLSPWLRTTRWHELLVDHNPSDLMKLVEYPTRAEYPSLYTVIQDLISGAVDCIDRTTTLVLQNLNSPRAPYEVTNKPFKAHADSTTLPKYTRFLTGLVTMLLRGTIVPLPHDVNEKLKEFKASLTRQSTEDAVARLFELLLLIWGRSWLVTESQRVVDPTIIYVALSSLTLGGRFQDPKFVTQTISAFEYLMRLVFLRAIHSYPSLDDGTKALQPWFIEKTESTFNSLRTLQHFASSIAYQTMNLPRIWWTDRSGYKSMLYQGYPVELQRIVRMLEGLEKKLKDLWENDLLFSLDLSVTYSSLYDDLSNKDPGYSFTTDPKNSIFQDQQILLRAILNKPSLRSRFIVLDSTSSFRWNVYELRRWLTTYALFGLLLLIRCNLTGGSPGRITELTAAQLVNLATYAVRNLVIFNKHVALLCTYLKTSALTGYDRLIPHSLDSFTSDLLIQDLAIARPFARLAARISHPNRPDIIRRFDTHIFVNHTTLFTTDDVTQMLTKLGLPYFEFPLNVSSWRHISTAFRRLHCARFQRLLDEEDNDSVDARQSGHSKQTENRIYGLSHDTLSGAGEDVLPLYLDASTDWQMTCSVVPGGTGLPYQKAMMGFYSSLVEAGAIGRPETSGASLEDSLTQLEKRLLARIGDLESKLMSWLSARLYPTYTDCPSPISDLESSLVSSFSSDDPISSSSSSISSANDFTPESWESTALDVLRNVLRQPNATWTNEEQRTSILAMLEHKRDAVIIMATGSGKSMIPVIPALVEVRRTTVLILPFRSLVIDFASRLTRMSVPFEVYSPTKRLSALVNLVIVSADHATTDKWRESIVMVNLTRPVVRYVLDEAHIPPTTSDYREALKYMSDIRCSFPVQMALMTATAHTRLIGILRHKFCIGSDALVLRMPTNRPELRYIWTSCSIDSVADAIRGLVKDHIKLEGDRGLIFVPFLNDGATLSQSLGYPFYHGKVEETAQRTLYNEWLSGQTPILIATSAFGTGNDYPHVRLVVHAGNPFEMISFIQEVSRAGRDKLPATCVLLQSGPPRAIPDGMTEENDLSGRISMNDALYRHSHRCIRFSLTSYIDGRSVYCSSLPGNQICSRCSSLNERTRSSSFGHSTQQAKRIRLERQVQENDYICSFKELLSRFENSCAFCLVFSVKNSGHGIKECPTLTEELGRYGYGCFLDWRRCLRYSEHHSRICFHCHVPQGPNDALHATFERTKSSCRYPDVIAPAVFAILLDNGLRNAAAAHFNLALAAPSDALPFINGPPLPSHSSNLTALFLWFGNIRCTPLSQAT